MKTLLDCVPCFLRQALEAGRMVTDDEEVHLRVIRRILAELVDHDLRRSPPEMGAAIHRILREETGCPDPYAGAKARFNRFALGLLPELRRRIEAEADPFRLAVRAAIAGNVIDFAQGVRISEESVRQDLEEILLRPLAVDDVERLRRGVEAAGSILYLADNAGEIVWDRLLIERMDTERVTLVVRGSPVLNDATLEDAREAGLTDLVEVLPNGSDVPGTLLPDCSEEVQALYRSADLVISKGQGNYETLSHADREVFYLFKAKCPAIAGDVGCRLGDIVVLREVGTAGA